jgi:ketosteroid isomerase-like protein
MMEECGDGTSALKTLLATEYAFSQRARQSIREAFLDYLAEGSLVLEPLPVPGRAFYSAAKDNSDQLEWYPTLADLSGSGDLGFTTGPWIYTAAVGGAPLRGDFLTIWKRDAACRWRVEVDGGISHGIPSEAEPEATVDGAMRPALDTPPQSLIAEDAAGEAMRAFEKACRQDGLAAALRTYARTADFRFYTDGELPMGLGAADRHLSAPGAHAAVLGTWREAAHGRSRDSSLAYAVGALYSANQRSSYAYVQIWQYGAKVANWGLRILLINPVPAMSK